MSKEDNQFKKIEKEEPNLDAMQNKTNTELVDEIAALDLEAKRIELAYRKQEMAWRAKDMIVKDEEIANITSKKNAAIEQARSKQLATMQFLANREANQKRCNHRKGGRGPDAVMRGMGDDAMSSVIFHKMPDGSMFVLCQRCGKEWYGARKWNTEHGLLKPLPPTEGWENAVQLATDNSPSGSSTFLFEKVEK